jgi:hypothetical protein
MLHYKAPLRNMRNQLSIQAFRAKLSRRLLLLNE